MYIEWSDEFASHIRTPVTDQNQSEVYMKHGENVNSIIVCG